MSNLPPTSARYYPATVEQWWVEQVKNSSVHTLENLHRNASTLSNHFTVSREKGFPDYFKKPGHLLAYGIYFHPQSWARVRFPLLEAIQHRGWASPKGRSLSILDAGSGPGSASLSAIQLLSTLYPECEIRTTAVDRSPHALEAMRGSHADLHELWPKSTLRTHSRNLRHRSSLFYGGKQRFDLIILSFSLNEFVAGGSPEEIAGQLASASRDLLKKNGLLLVVEPALRETARNLCVLTDQLAGGDSLYTWGPYFHKGPCPLRDSERFWCHEVRSWQPPKSLEYLNRHMQRKIHELKFSFSTLSPSPPPTTPSTKGFFRIASPVSRMKGHFLMTGVDGEGKAQEYELLYRNLDPSQKKSMRKMERGDILEISNLETVGNSGRLRIPAFADIIQHYHVL